MTSIRFWICAGVLTVVSAITVAWQARRLPWQNLLAAAVIAILVAGLAEAVFPAAAFGFPFNERFRETVVGWRPFAAPLLWVAALFSSRLAAQVLLRRFRKHPWYGIWLALLTLALVLLFALGFDTLEGGGRTTHEANGAWQATTFPAVPIWQLFLWRAVLSVVMLVSVTPWLISKRPFAAGAVLSNA